jgi:hypothetical protein
LPAADDPALARSVSGVWKEAVRIEQQRQYAEVQATALTSLKTLLNCDDEKMRMKAARMLEKWEPEMEREARQEQRIREREKCGAIDATRIESS